MVRTKIIKIGNSFGVILPVELIRQKNVNLGEKIDIDIINTQKYDVMKFFGTMRKMPSFDEIERETDEED